MGEHAVGTCDVTHEACGRARSTEGSTECCRSDGRTRANGMRIGAASARLDGPSLMCRAEEVASKRRSRRCSRRYSRRYSMIWQRVWWTTRAALGAAALVRALSAHGPCTGRRSPRGRGGRYRGRTGCAGRGSPTCRGARQRMRAHLSGVRGRQFLRSLSTSLAPCHMRCLPPRLQPQPEQPAMECQTKASSAGVRGCLSAQSAAAPGVVRVPTAHSALPPPRAVLAALSATPGLCARHLRGKSGGATSRDLPDNTCPAFCPVHPR